MNNRSVGYDGPARRSRNQNRTKHYHHEVIHDLTLATEHENTDLRHAGMDAASRYEDAPETSMSTWIPALHAGMTNRGVV